ncbi:MAG: amidohydrolase family protein [Rhodobacteraceae bacterium]|nr:amidohydrolase family protein [Paracoccaceae bacterium]
MSPKVDAHLHYWDPARGDYGWMPMDDPVLARHYGPEDLAAARESAGITHTVLVQAAPTVAESHYLLGIAATEPSVAGVVGWIDFEDPLDLRELDAMAEDPKFLGVRPMIQDIPDIDWMLRDDIQWAFEALIERDLTLDALGFPEHLDNFHRLLTRYPDLRVVIDHCMKPRIRDYHSDAEGFARWAAGMTRLADETGACCKLSGLVTEASSDWTVDGLRPAAAHVIEAFGAKRVMWGSDWPVCRLRAEYGEWHDAALVLTDGLDETGRDAVFGGTANTFYRLTL